ncbi:MAG TPA: DUF6056 family protein [Kofleriaceae bacterium]|nr:DUF6056 family protein [Kofleriaceae bacterium]
MPWPRILRALFVAYVAATLAHVAWIMAHEPFSFDAWNVAVDTHARPFSLGNFFDYYKLEYTHSNPRIGQALTYLAYKLEYFAVVATPLAYLVISLAITVLALGRFPLKRGRDLALWAFVVGAMWFTLPELPKTMFCRAYGANYVYGCAIQLAFLVPLRLTGGRASTRACIAYALFGVIAGMCNEHTGPTLAAALVAYAWWRGRNGERPLLAWAGAAGFVVGFAAIFFAPGQGERYDGLAQKASLFGRLVQRGVIGNLDILRDLLIGAAPILGLVAIALAIAANDPPDDGARRRALRGLALAMIAATAMAVTIFVSPKLGTRFYIFSASLLLAAFVALADCVLVTNRRLVPFVVIAVGASIYAGARTIPIYARVKRASDARIAALEASPPGRVFVAGAFEQVDDSWWFLGDDFRDSKKREMVAEYFALPGVVFRSYDMWAPLGVAGARFVPHYTVDPPSCVDEHGGFSLGSTKGFDLEGVHREMKIAIEVLRERLGSSARLEQLDLAVELDDPNIVLPRPRVLVGRWRPDHFEGYVGEIVRKTRAFTRDVIVPRELRTPDREVYAYLVGGEAKRLGLASDDTLRYVPWAPGVYWMLACGRDDCFVIAATRQAI